MTGETATPDWSALACSLSGAVVLPGDDRYAWCRRQFVASETDTLPQAVARCSGPTEVAAALAFARTHGLPFAIRSGGHSFADHSSTPGLLLDLSALDTITVDGDTASIGAGATIGAVTTSLARRGRWLPGGGCPTVGMGGIALAGGFGLLGRRYGLTTDHMLAADIVLADGTHTTVDAEHEPDLFWALRGAGAGNFGVVTSFSFTTVPTAPLTVLHAVWPAEYAIRLIDRWQHWVPDAGDELTVEIMLVAAGPPEEPPIVRMFGNILADTGTAAETLADIVDAVGAPPARHGIRAPDAAAAARYLTGYDRWTGDEMGLPRGPFPEPGLQATKSEFFDQPLPVAAIAALIDLIGRNRTTDEYRELNLIPWGGAYRQKSPTSTAFIHRHQQFMIRHTVQAGPPVTHQQRQTAQRWLTESWHTVHPHGTGRVYQGYPDPDLPDWPNAYYGANLPRLREVKATYDPDNVFTHSQSIPAHHPQLIHAAPTSLVIDTSSANPAHSRDCKACSILGAGSPHPAAKTDRRPPPRCPR